MNDGKLNMIKLADAAKDEAIVQTPATGLVGMPTQTQYGANFKLLLNPAVHMWSLVQLKNSEIAEAQVTPGQAQMPLDKEWIYQVIALTLPIQAGDECLVVFGDMCIDGWWQSGGVQNQVECRRHDLSDGFAIIGVWSQPRVFSEYRFFVKCWGHRKREKKSLAKYIHTVYINQASENVCGQASEALTVYQ